MEGKIYYFNKEKIRVTISDKKIIYETKTFSKKYNFIKEFDIDDILEIVCKQNEFTKEWWDVTISTQKESTKLPFLLTKEEQENKTFETFCRDLPNLKIDQPKEIVKKCKTCGKIFCYTEMDVKKNEENKNTAMIANLGVIASGLFGSRYDMYEQNKIAKGSSNAVVDFDRCPHCGSRDITDVSNENKKDEIDVVQELKKYKELLDSGIISQEEFDKKKKELLK